MTRLWYRIALAHPNGTRAYVAAQGEHLGIAIAAAEAHHKKSRAIAAAVCAESEIPLGDSVGKPSVVELAPDAAPDSPTRPAFAWPLGTLPQLGHEAALADARAGYMERPEGTLHVVEIQVPSDRLVDTFLGLIERVPAADNLEVKLLDHFEDAGRTDVWLTSRVDAKRIIRFLDDHDDELLHNGHVEVAVYLRAQHATLRLTEHKTIVWVADDRALAGELAKWLTALKVPLVTALTTIAAVPHFHYRAGGSKDRKKLSETLFRQRLRRVDTTRPLTAG